MTAEPARGWCPGVYAPMASGDGLLVRVTPPGGRMDPAQIAVLAEAAQRFGNGIVGLTGRGNWQIRGLRPGTVAPFAQAMVAAGLALPDPRQERRRRVIAAPPADDALVTTIETALLDTPALDALPAKVAVLVGSAGQADVIVRAGGIGIAGATSWAPFGGAEDVVALLDGFMRLGADSRMAALVRRVGAAAVYAAAGLQADQAVPPPRHPRIGIDGEDVLAALPFGLVDATTLRALADIAGVRTVPAPRALLIENAASRSAALAALGLITDAADPRLDVAVCAGLRCARATVDAVAAARECAARGIAAHVSGCRRGCAHPGPSALTLVGRGGQWDVIRNGRAGDVPVATGLTFPAARDLAHGMPV